jgi:hypothetical protein
VKVQVLPAHQYKNFEEDIKMSLIAKAESENRRGI